MKKFLIVISIFLMFISSLFAGDTIVVPTFTWGWPVNAGWGAPREGKFLFPSDTIRFEKILMAYKLKCDPSQNPQCGEWDYLTYTNLYQHTGMLDSNLFSHTNFLVNRSEFDSVKLSFLPSYLLFPHYNYQTSFQDTVSIVYSQVGIGATTVQYPINAGQPDICTRFLWRKNELIDAGLIAGNIWGLKMFINNSAIQLSDFVIRIKTNTIDSLNSILPLNENYIQVFSGDANFQNSGWNDIIFNTPFNWDGNSHLVIEFSFKSNLIQQTVKADLMLWQSAMVASITDKYLEFKGTDYIGIPANVFESIDSAVTIAFWQYGNESIQPHDDIIFEGIDSAGNRVLNAHLPWSDSKVYWDAGNIGDTYDRIQKLAGNSTQYKGKWNHWAFTKDVGTGIMRIFLNGASWYVSAAKTKLMKGIKKFKIGSSANGSSMFYNGKIDDFCVFDVALDALSLKELMYVKNPLFANYQHLLARYSFDEQNGLEVVDNVNGLNGQMVGFPTRKNYDGFRVKYFDQIYQRPTLNFIQGEFILHQDSVLIFDTIQNNPLMVEFFNDTIHPSIPTDTMYMYQPQYNFTYDILGNIIDTIIVSFDTTINKISRNYFGEPFEVLNRFELGRYITPYGNGLSLGDGWTWIYDVTDFRTLLKDFVHLSSGNWQELLELKFYMIKGTPARDVVKIENVWQGDFSLNQFDTKVTAKTIQLEPQAGMFKLRTTLTGHQFSNATNCAEFCPKIHSLSVNGTTRYSWQIIQECSKNPLYPQGGTWIYARAGWCPGMPGAIQQLELSQYVTGSDVTIDYDIDYDEFGNYVTESQLVSYSDPNFTNDAAVVDVLKPNKYELYRRFNPICGKPLIKIQNNGSATLTSLNIQFRVNGGAFQNYQWTGNLEFLETEEVNLPVANWTTVNGSDNLFEVLISDPSGMTDEYQDNNIYRTKFSAPVAYNKPVVIVFKTNSASSENRYEVLDCDGNIIFSKSTFTNNTLFQDTLNLSAGCYEFVMHDLDEDGISWWANSDGAGYLQLKLVGGSVVQTFNPDFGSEVRFQFSIVEPSGNHYVNSKNKIHVYPNPVSNLLTVESEEGIGEVCIYDFTGKVVYYQKINSQIEKIDVTKWSKESI